MHACHCSVCSSLTAKNVSFIVFLFIKKIVTVLMVYFMPLNQQPFRDAAPPVHQQNNLEVRLFVMTDMHTALDSIWLAKDFKIAH